MTNKLSRLYNQIILERQKDDTGYEKREKAAHQIEAYNPLCGDQYKLYIDISEGKITGASYYGYGCALSKASTSLLIENLPGKSIDECRKSIQSYLAEIDGEHPQSSELIKALSMAKDFPGRAQCTVLSWKALEKFLNKIL